jgi:hypothetical protein
MDLDAVERLERRNGGSARLQRSVAGRSGVAFYPVRVSDLAIFDYGDWENSEERYFRLLKGQ